MGPLANHAPAESLKARSWHRMHLSVHLASSEDTEKLARVHLLTVISAYADILPSTAPTPSFEAVAAEWQSTFDDPTCQAFLAEDSGIPVGTVAIRADPHFAGCGQLRRLHVLPEHWNVGIGSALHLAALEAIRDGGYGQAGLWVLQANERARNFYERRGWTLVPDVVLRWSGLDVVEVRYSLTI